ncbi:hypothetical protein EKL97_15405 [Flavobacterium sp. LS1P28]|uniref:hypothetical protein n=1 Tax=Flavobacterium sp. LS1P28 TaxID=2497752 RepID=UPI000F81EC5B|nr:hypothetical protein [Flavobacterium sp. LS1P28]RTY77470.1 hypothetical protein EKL97_15405 [Flavobacterium sp. LS1P28]
MSHISSLYLFAKETDSVETVRGFKFQELKTLETWLSNKINGIDEIIYCDYEEDIFQRDLATFKATFKQLKLYSSKNFSFASTEITKAIAHFFMLFVKGDYLLDKITFVFETNTSIAAKKGDNDAELLNDWAAGQDSLDVDLLLRCTAKLKSILDAYIEEQYGKLKKGENENLDNIKQIYEELPIETWELFAKSIRWNFTGISAEQALNNSIAAIKNSIEELPFPITKDQHDIVFDKLRGIVSDKSMAVDPEERKLSNGLMTQAVLDLGSRDDKSYNKDYEIWKVVEKIIDFKMGEFYQVLYAARHCRRNKYLLEHAQKWNMLLLEYYNNAQTPAEEKREVIYELVWSTLRPVANKKPENSLKGLEPLVEQYFSDFEQYKKPQAAEDALNLITVVDAVTRFALISINEEKITEWYSRFEDFLTDAKELYKDRKHDLVRVLEIESFFILNRNSLEYGDEQENLRKVKTNFDRIIALLPEAPMFSVSQLGERVSLALQMYFNMKMEAKEVEIIEEFSEALEPFVLARDRDKDTAKGYIIKGDEYLNSVNSKGILKALAYFHKAKNLYLNDDYAEGYTLALLNISQFYCAVGMNIAAKHYALAVIWYVQNAGDPTLYKRISDAYGLLFHYEFKQGSWINALQNFETVAAYRNELDPRPFDPFEDESLMKKMVEVSYILAISPIISPQLSAFIEYEKQQMGSLYTDLLHDFTAGVISHAGDENSIRRITESKVDSPPINDIGEFRTLSWKVFGSVWNVTFRNDFILNSVGEEFCSLIQVFLTDIAVYELDFHLLKDEINIEIVLSDVPKPPEQIADNSKYSWRVYLQLVASNDSRIINRHYAFISTVLKIILDELSLLPSERFEELFKVIMSKDIGSKALLLNAYQLMYRKEFSKDKFNDSKRSHFKREYLPITHFQAKPLHWNNNTSNLYNHEENIENIGFRYLKNLKKIAITFEKIKDIPAFITRIKDLREKGWLDWQILMALMNTIFNYKANIKMSILQRNYLLTEENAMHFRQIITDLHREGENVANYIEIPLQEIIGENLLMHLEQSSLYVLKSFGLENRSRFPNYTAVMELLNNRFNFAQDDLTDNSPFQF